MNRITALAVVAIFYGYMGSAHGVPLTLSFSDPVGDNTGAVDLVGLTFNFDNSTGNYQIDLTADAANPFLGNFRLNINLFNVDTGTTAQDPSFFSDTVNDFNLAVATTMLSLVGTNSRLLSWDPGDRIAVSGPLPLGVPDGVAAFGSSVLDLPDTTSFDNMAPGEFSILGEPVSVPVPSSLVLIGLGLGLAAGRRFMFDHRRSE